MSTCAGCVTSFTTFHGTGIQGMWITWGNTATSKTGSIVAADELSVDVELRLYAVNLDTRTFPTDNVAVPINASNDKMWTMDWFIQIMNPNEGPLTANVATGVPGDFSQCQYDAAVGFLEITTQSGPGATRDTAVATWATPGLSDMHCSADGVNTSDGTICVQDTAATGADNLTAVTGPADDHCIEKWNLQGDNGIRCVRMKSQFTRKFLTTEATGTHDIDLDYRPYQVSTGWTVESGTTFPLQIAFPRQSVDLGRFRRVTPEADYNSAISGLGLTCASLAAAIMSTLF